MERIEESMLTAFNKELKKEFSFVNLNELENPEQYTWLCKFCQAEMVLKELPNKLKYFAPKVGH